jgi:hypothetical protein
MSEDSAHDLATSPEMRPYLRLAKAALQGSGGAPELEAIRQLPLEKRYVFVARLYKPKTRATSAEITAPKSLKHSVPVAAGVQRWGQGVRRAAIFGYANRCRLSQTEAIRARKPPPFAPRCACLRRRRPPGSMLPPALGARHKPKTPPTTQLVLPKSEPGVVDGDSPRRQLVQQPRHCGGRLTVSRYDHCPF